MQPSEVAERVERNIKTLVEREKREEQSFSWSERLAHLIGSFAGSMTFVTVHVIFFGLWTASNLGLLRAVPAFDPTFTILGTTASVEAILLSTFILINQNRMQLRADKQADLNLQINLLAETEVTRILTIVTELGQRLNLPSAGHPELEELQKDVEPGAVLDTIDARQAQR